jgi:ABC-type sugar transport system ATPase subunit
MDEPTSSLSLEETEQLFGIIRRLRDEGVAIIYISHRLEELKEIGDRVTIMRDGRHVHTAEVATTDIATMIRHMVGRELTDMYPKEAVPLGQERLRVEDLSTEDGRVSGASLCVRAGEIVGLAGLVGAGRTELAEAVFGIRPIASGRITVDGQERRFSSPHDAINAGLALLTEDRKRTGLLLNLPVTHNTTVAALERLLKGPHLPLGDERRMTEEYVERLNIRTPSVRQIALRLSGGNQQKVVLAKWLFAQSQVLIFDEPTLGIDVGAKVEVYRLLGELARQGAAILMISSELPELLAMSDTLLAMRRGEVVATLDPQATDQEEVLRYMALGADPEFHPAAETEPATENESAL